MAKSRRNPPESIDPNQLKTRDQLMVAVINGVTKAYVEKDQRREASKKACRGKIQVDGW